MFSADSYSTTIFFYQDEIHRDGAEEKERDDRDRGAKNQSQECRRPPLRAAREHPRGLCQEDGGDALQPDAERNPRGGLGHRVSLMERKAPHSACLCRRYGDRKCAHIESLCHS